VKNKPWSKWSWRDVKSDTRLKLCGSIARATWFAILAEMDDAEPYGHLVFNGSPMTNEQLSILSGLPLEEIIAGIDELERNGVFSRRKDIEQSSEYQGYIGRIENYGVNMSAHPDAIVNRRMIRDAVNFLNGRKGGQQTAQAGKSLDNLTQNRKVIPMTAGGFEPPFEPRSTEDKSTEVANATSDAGSADLTEEQDKSVRTEKPTQAALFEEPKPDKPTNPELKALWSEGIRILSEIYSEQGKRKSDDAIRAMLGKLAGKPGVKGDPGRLLELIRESRAKADPVPWLEASASTFKPRLVTINDKEDPWGIDLWCRSRGFSPTQSDSDKARGKWIANFGPTCIPIIDNLAKRVATAARFPRTFAPDWDVMAEWVKAGLDKATIVAQIQRRSEEDGYDPKQISTLRFFNSRVGYRKAA
jgi:hypothetical protein